MSLALAKHNVRWEFLEWFGYPAKGKPVPYEKELQAALKEVDRQYA